MSRKLPQATGRKSAPQRNFDDIVRTVNLDAGYIHVGFIQASREEQKQLRRGMAENNDIVNTLESQRNDSWTARMIGWLSRDIVSDIVSAYASTFKYWHCEIAMPLSGAGKAQFDNDSVMAIGISSDVGVFVRARHFDDEYEWQAVKCSRDSMWTMLHFAYCEWGKPVCFKQTTNAVLYPGPETREKYLCPQLIMACLEFLPLPDFHLNPGNKLTVDELYDLVARERNQPDRMQELTTVQARRTLGAAAMRGPDYQPSRETQRRLENPV